MANIFKKSVSNPLPEGVFTERRINGVVDGIPYGDAAAHTMNRISTEELRQRNESLMENIGALRFSIARIELLEAQKRALVVLLGDLRPVLQSAGYAEWDQRVLKTLASTQE